MIVINKRPNITHLPYTLNGRKGVFPFVPGQNRIEAATWAAVKKAAGEKRMAAYYNSFLTTLEDGRIDAGELNADEFIDLIQGAMSLDLLEDYAKAESSREGGSRKTVMAAIEKQAAEIEEIETRKNQGK
jgi:hypothetical protein